MVFHLLGPDAWWRAQCVQLTHLPAPLRRVGATATAADVIKARYPKLSSDSMIDESIAAEIDARGFLAQLTGSRPDYEVLRHARDPEHHRLMSEVRQEWKRRVRSLLVPHAYTSRLPQ